MCSFDPVKFLLLLAVFILQDEILTCNSRKLDKVSFVPSRKSSHVFKRMTTQNSAESWWQFPPTRRLISPRQRSRLSQSSLGLTPRIIGGHLAREANFPFVLTLVVEGELECGATLIEVLGLQVALTAAHCIYPYQASQIAIVAGQLNWLHPTGNEQARYASSYIVHDDFDSFTDANDIAIIFLPAPFMISSHVRPANLPDQGWYDPVHIEFIGFGAVMDGGRASFDLKWVGVNVLPSFECVRMMYHGQQLTRNQICSGGPTVPGGGEGQCDGDSGGPGMGNNFTLGVYYLAAIPSFGLGRCGDPVFPEVSTRVSAYIDWINLQVSDHINMG